MKRNYYISKNGTLQRKDNSLNFKIEEGDHKYIPVEDVDSLYIFGEVTLNTKLINFLSQNGVILHFFNYYGFYTGTFYPREKLNSGYLFVEQVKHYTEKDKRVKIAKEIIKSASYNIHRNVRYYNERGRDLNHELGFIEDMRKKIDFVEEINELMGVEGNIRKKYYEAFNKIVNQEINFEKRVKRPPDNMINSLISFCNSIVYTTVLSEIYHTQLTPLVSYLHEPSERRFSLSLDIAEIFKPLIADRLIFTVLNKNMINEDDFEKELNYVYIKDRARKVIIEEFDKRLETTIKHRTLGREVSYRYLIRLELYKLVKHLTGEKEYEGFNIWW